MAFLVVSSSIVVPLSRLKNFPCHTYTKYLIPFTVDSPYSYTFWLYQKFGTCTKIGKVMSCGKSVNCSFVNVNLRTRVKKASKTLVHELQNGSVIHYTLCV